MPSEKKPDEEGSGPSSSKAGSLLGLCQEFLNTDGLRLVRFAIAGSASTAFYFAIVLLLLGLTDVRADIASLLGYMAAIGFSYMLQSRFTFGVPNDTPRQVGAFIMVSISGLLLSWIVMAYLHLRWELPAAWVAALICVVIPAMNYIFFKWFVFLKRTEPPKSPRT